MITIVSIIFVGMLLPASTIIPVKDATCRDWNSKTFWFEPWGSSGVHKGIDIFAASGQPVLSATSGVVLYSGELSKGGKVVLTLGPKWRLYYYAHLNEISPDIGLWVNKGEKLGSVGRTGNAIGKPAHLHYSVVTAIPYPWLISSETQGWKKMFYLDPAETFQRCVQ